MFATSVGLLNRNAARAARQALKEQAGDVLVFSPGCPTSERPKAN